MQCINTLTPTKTAKLHANRNCRVARRKRLSTPKLPSESAKTAKITLTNHYPATDHRARTRPPVGKVATSPAHHLRLLAPAKTVVQENTTMQQTIVIRRAKIKRLAPLVNTSMYSASPLQSLTQIIGGTATLKDTFMLTAKRWQPL